MTGDAPTATPSPPPSRWWVDALWLLALGAYATLYCVYASPRIGITYDEPFYIDAGMDSWRGWWRTDGKPKRFWHESGATNGVMPLPPDVVAAPVAIHEYRHNKEKLTSEMKLCALPAARLMTLFWLSLLVLSAWRIGRIAAGPWGGRIAAGLIAADPTVLAHATLATTDVAVTAALTAFAGTVYAGRSGGWWWRLVLPGAWYGVAAACKLSALLYGGVILVVLEVCHRLSTGALFPDAGRGFGAWARKFAGATARSVLAAAVVVALGLGLARWFHGVPDEGRRPFETVAKRLPPDDPLKEDYLRWAEEYEPVPHIVTAFAFQWWWNYEGRPSFLNGTYYPAGYRWFFPVVIAMKTPLPVILLALAALLRPRALWLNAFTVAALALVAVALKGNLQLGVRLALPAIALGYVAVAVAVARGYPRRAPWLGVPAVLAVALTSLWVWPHGLGYLNQLYGGPDQAIHRLSDSNNDWGQGIPDLRAWHEANGRPNTIIWYFGVDPAARRPPFQQFPLESHPIKTPEDLRKWVGPQVLAVGHSVITLHSERTEAKVVALRYLATRKPLGRTATFLLYDFRDPAGPPPLGDGDEPAFRPARMAAP